MIPFKPVVLAVISLVLTIFTCPAHAMRAIDFDSFSLPAGGAIALPVAESETLTGVAAEIDQLTGGQLSIALAEAQFSGKTGETLTLYGLAPFARIDLVGVGSDRLDRVAAEDFGGRLASLNDGKSGTPVQVLWHDIDREEDAGAERVAFGFALGDYRFDRYKEERTPDDQRSSLTIYSDDVDAAQSWASDLSFLALSIHLARDLSTEPGNVIYPQSFIDRVREAFDDVDNAKISVLDEKDLERLGMGSHLSVGQGSARPPRLLVIEYNGGNDGPPLVLAGKGITFDTGGTSLKEKTGMERMKADMTGAAVVSATVLAAAQRGSSANLVALAALAENMPGSRASRPGDVFSSMSGKTIEIKSTDAEGRLVLADAVWYGQEEFQPDLLIDVATLTGSAARAVGEGYSALFSNDDALAEQIAESGRKAGEPSWRLPLDPLHYEQISSDIADVRNGGSGNAGASHGAAFIGTFIQEGQPWIHFDIASVDYAEKAMPTVPKGYSAHGIRMLDQFIRDTRE